MRTPATVLRTICLVLAAGSLAAAGWRSPAQPGAVGAAAIERVGGGADAASTARRTAGPQPTSTCRQVAYNVGLHQPGTTQVVVVLTPSATSTSGTLQVADLGPTGWVCSAAVTARVGKNGVRPLQQRRSGDGTTPAGVFPLGTMTAWDGRVFSMFGNSADPGVVAGPYRRVRSGDCFGATPNTARYGHLVQRAQGDCTSPDEYLPAITGAYEHAALIGANMEPDVSGDAPGEIPYASAIFLHRYSFDANGNSKATAGCVSLSHNDLVDVLRSMRPGVRFAIGETGWLLANS